MMSGIEKIKDILDNSIEVKSKWIKKLPTKNGVLDNIDININKGFCLIEGLTESSNGLITYRQEYPKDEESIVTFNTDLVVMKGEDYRELLELINNGNK